MKVSKGVRITLLVVLLLIIDQVIKILVKTNMSIGESIHLFGSWFQILFIENNGMAFGLQFGEGFGKLALSLCRLALIALIIVYLTRLVKRPETPNGVLVGLAAILCGAIGNEIDSIFYGVIFDYAPLFYGKVVDMLYFPLIHNAAGETLFFRPVFNLADSYITIAVFAIILFFRKDLNDSLETDKSSTETKKAAE